MSVVIPYILEIFYLYCVEYRSEYMRIKTQIDAMLYILNPNDKAQMTNQAQNPNNNVIEFLITNI